MSLNFQDKYGHQALDAKQHLDHFTGNSIKSGCAPSAGSSGLEVDIASGTAIVNGSEVSVSAQTVTLSSADADDPRKDVVTIDSNGSATVYAGTPESRKPEQNASKFDLQRPAPQDLSGTDEAVVAEVFVAEGSTSLGSTDVRDRRILSVMEASSVNSFGSIDLVNNSDINASGNTVLSPTNAGQANFPNGVGGGGSAISVNDDFDMNEESISNLQQQTQALEYSLDSSSTDKKWASIGFRDASGIDIGWASDRAKSQAFKVEDITNNLDFIVVNDSGQVDLPEGPLNMANSNSIEDAGTDAIRFDGSANLTIPNGDVEMQKTQPIVQLNDTGSSFPRIEFQNSGGGEGSIDAATGSRLAIRDRTAGIDKFRMKYGGSVELLTADSGGVQTRRLEVTTNSDTADITVQAANLDLNNNNIDDVASIDGGGDAISVNDEIDLQGSNDLKLDTDTYFSEFFGGMKAVVADSGAGDTQFLVTPSTGGVGDDYFVALAHSNRGEGVFINSAPATSTTTTQNSGLMRLDGQYWDGSASQSATAWIENVVDDTTPSNHLEFEVQNLITLKMFDSGNITIPNGNLNLNDNNIDDVASIDGGGSAISVNDNIDLQQSNSIDNIKELNLYSTTDSTNSLQINGDNANIKNRDSNRNIIIESQGTGGLGRDLILSGVNGGDIDIFTNDSGGNDTVRATVTGGVDVASFDLQSTALNMANSDSIQDSGTDAIQFDGSANITLGGNLDLNSNKIIFDAGSSNLNKIIDVNEDGVDAFEIEYDGSTGSGQDNFINILSNVVGGNILSTDLGGELTLLSDNGSSTMIERLKINKGSAITSIDIKNSNLDMNSNNIQDAGTDAIQFDGSANITIPNGDLDLNGQGQIKNGDKATENGMLLAELDSTTSNDYIPLAKVTDTSNNNSDIVIFNDRSKEEALKIQDITNNTLPFVVDDDGTTTMAGLTNQPGTSSNPILQLGDSGAGFFVNSSGEVVVVDETGNTTTIS